MHRAKDAAAWVTTVGIVAGALLPASPASASPLPAPTDRPATPSSRLTTVPASPSATIPASTSVTVPAPKPGSSSSSGPTSSGPTASGRAAPAAEGAAAASAVEAATEGWGPCSDAELDKAGARCGTVTVPLDHRRPGGTKITLALSLVPHTVREDRYQGVMLVNPGGPGGSGRSFAVLGSAVPDEAGAAYDWIGFDPRGVGSSRPALSCDDDYFDGPRPDYVPSDPASEDAWLSRAKAYAAACGANGGALLGSMRTEDVARDLDLVRAALDVSRINFYGFSYGTYLAQVYATLFPGRVRRMVLDSNVDPRYGIYRSGLDQGPAFQRNLGLWWTWVAKNNATFRLGATRAAVERAWFAEKDRLREDPAGDVVGASEWTDIFLAAGYDRSSWPELAQLWSRWAGSGDPDPVVSRYRDSAAPDGDNAYAAYTAVQCTDSPSPRTWTRWKSDSTALNRRAPSATWATTWLNAPCLFWPAPAGPAVNVTGRDVPPVLLVGETLDAATPFAGSLEVRRRFPKARLVSVPGGTNHAFSLSGNTCLDDRIAAYLTDGTLPARRAGNVADATCAPLPAPEPVPTARPTRAGSAPAAQ